jgi:hypothetical protein
MTSNEEINLFSKIINFAVLCTVPGFPLPPGTYGATGWVFVHENLRSCLISTLIRMYSGLCTKQTCRNKKNTAVVRKKKIYIRFFFVYLDDITIR